MNYGNKKYKHTQGFSLIEAVVYVSILAVISIFVINIILSMAGFAGTLRKNHSLADSAQVSLERMTREIRMARSVDEVNSVLGSSPGVLTLNTFDDMGAETTAVFQLNNGAIVFKKGDDPFSSLTSSEIAVSSLIFRTIANATSTATTSEAVRIEAIMEFGEGDRRTAYNFYDTIILRRSY